MSHDSEDEAVGLENVEEVLDSLIEDIKEIRKFKDYFFENHPIELAKDKNTLVNQKKDIIVAKFDAINESQIPQNIRAQFLYQKGRCLNINPNYDPRALECLSKAVKLDPHLVNAWNELGECYWKNLNIKEARVCFEGALKQQRHRRTLRSLSIILRQECSSKNRTEATEIILRSVDLAKESVALYPKDGMSWCILGNAYLCQFFLVSQQPATLKLCQSAYKQAWNDPIARGHPDLHYNQGIVHKYEEKFEEALQALEMAYRLDPPWAPPNKEMNRLVHYLQYVDDLVHTKGRIKVKRIQQMVKSMDIKMYGEYAPGSECTINKNKMFIERATLDELKDGENEGKVVLGRVVGSIHSDNAVPFTFAIIDESMSCVAVNVYNWADGRGVIIGDCVALPAPRISTHTHTMDYPSNIDKSEFIGVKSKEKGAKNQDKLSYNFRSIRVNNPTMLLVNGKRVGREQFACTKVTSTYEAH